MKTLQLRSGRSTTYDDSFKEGDLITNCWSGLYKFIRYQDRGDEAAPLVYSKQVFRDNGQPLNVKKISCCDASYCRKADGEIRKRLNEIEREKERLSKILKDLTEN